MVKMTALSRERRKSEIAESIRRDKLKKEMRLGFPFDTDEGRKYQSSFRKTGIR